MKSVFTERYQRLLTALIEARKSANITQQDLASRLSRPQSFVSKYEHGERRLDIIEFLDVAHAIGANPYDLISTVDLGVSDNHSSETNEN